MVLVKWLIACGIVEAALDGGTMGEYFYSNEVSGLLWSLNEKYPELTSLVTIGTSFNRNDIVGLKISESSTPKPTMVISASQQSGFPISTSAALTAAYDILESSSNSYIKYLINSRDIYIFPILNPDAYKWTELEYSRGKGLVPMLTNRNNTRCSAFLNNGVRLNRNWKYMWNTTGDSDSDPCSDTFPGTAPFSEVETFSLKDFFENIKVVVWLHYEGTGNLYITPYTYLKTSDKTSNMFSYAYSVVESKIDETWKIGSSYELTNQTEDGSLIDYFASKGTVALQVAVGNMSANESSIQDELAMHYGLALEIIEMAGVYLNQGSTHFSSSECKHQCYSNTSALEMYFEYEITNSGLVDSEPMFFQFSLTKQAKAVNVMIETCHVAFINLFDKKSLIKSFPNVISGVNQEYMVDDFVITQFSKVKIAFIVSGFTTNEHFGVLDLIANFKLNYKHDSPYGISSVKSFRVESKDEGNNEAVIAIAVSVCVFFGVAIAIAVAIVIRNRKNRKLEKQEFNRSEYVDESKV